MWLGYTGDSRTPDLFTESFCFPKQWEKGCEFWHIAGFLKSICGTSNTAVGYGTQSQTHSGPCPGRTHS